MRCDDCKGSGFYIGFQKREFCKSCGGTGLKALKDEASAATAEKESGAGELPTSGQPLGAIDLIYGRDPEYACFEFKDLCPKHVLNLMRDAYLVYPMKALRVMRIGGVWTSVKSFILFDYYNCSESRALKHFRSGTGVIQDAYAIYKRVNLGTAARHYHDSIYKLVESR